MQLKVLLILLPFLLESYASEAKNTSVADSPQDTVYLLNGEKLAGEIVDTIHYKTRVRYAKKRTVFRRREKMDTMTLDNELVFAILYRNGREKIVYEQDSLAGNYFSPQEVRMFIYGQRDAQKNYHCPFATASSFLIGFGSGYIGSFLCLIPVFAYSGLLLIPKIKVKYNTVSNPEYLSSATYILGYEKVARKKKLFRSLISGISSVTVSLFTFQLLFPKL